MSTLRTYNLQSIDSGSVNIQLTPNAGAILAGLTTAQSGLDVTGSTILSGLTTAQSGLNITNGSVGIGTDNPEYDLDFGVGAASTIRLVSGPLGTAIRIGAGSNSNQVTLLRVDGGNPNHKGTTNNSAYGFSVKYMGDRAGNRNSLSIFSDNQTGTRHEAITILQDGRIGIGTNDPAGTNDENHAPVLTIVNDPSTAVSYGTSDAFVVKSKNIDGTGISTVFAIRPFSPSGPVSEAGLNPLYNVAINAWVHLDSAGHNCHFLADDAERTYVGFYTGASVDKIRAGEYTTLNGDGTPVAFGLASLTYRKTEGLTFNRGSGASADVSFKFKGKSTHGDDNKIVRFAGDSDALDVVNWAGGDYGFMNTQQNNLLSVQDGTGGILMYYSDDSSKAFAATSGGMESTWISNTSATSNGSRVRIHGNVLKPESSTRRMKNNIRNYVGAGLSRIEQMVPRTWEDHVSGETFSGFVAEEIHDIGFESAVVYREYQGGSEIGIGDTYGSMYGNGSTPVTKDGVELDDQVLVVDNIEERAILAELVVALKELKAENDSLKSRITALESN